MKQFLKKNKSIGAEHACSQNGNLKSGGFCPFYVINIYAISKSGCKTVPKDKLDKHVK